MKLKIAATLMVAACAINAHASSITYNSNLQNGISVTGQVVDTNYVAEPVGAQYYSFFANAGSSVTVIGDRLEGAFDMSFWVFRGLFSDTSAFSGGTYAGFDLSDPGAVDFGDDEDPANIAGPWGDPHVMFSAPSTGYYTVAVTNFASNPSGDGFYDFQLVARGIQNVPEPASIALLGLGLAGLGASRRRAKQR